MSIAELEMRLKAAKAAWSTAHDTARAATSWAEADSAWSNERYAKMKLGDAEDALAAACLKDEGER